MSLFDSQLTGRLRLRHLREVHEAKDEEMAEQRPRFHKLAREDSAPQVFSAFNLFPTPPALADKVIELADIHYGHHILEPSAGTGRLLDAIVRRFNHHVESGLVKRFSDLHIQVTAVEIDGPMWHHLSDSPYAMWVTARNADFLTWETHERFDRIVMNPPFKMGRDIKHIRRAIQWLKPGGKLVAICANGPKQNEQLKPLAAHWEVLPEGSFKEAATNVSAALFVFDK